MNIRHAPSHLAERFHRPLRFGRVWRGHELLLRVIQVALLITFAVLGAQWIARGVRMLAERLT